MTLTVAQIAAKALNAAQGAISDAVPVATLTRTTNGAYDADNDVYSTTAESWTGRAVFQSIGPDNGGFPGYVVGPTDNLIMLEGFTSVLVNDTLTIGARTLTVMAVRDLAGAGTLWSVMAR